MEETNKAHEIEMYRNEQLDCIEMREAQLLRKLVNILYFDPEDVQDEHGELKPLVDLPEHVLQGIADVQVRFSSRENDDAGRPILHISIKIKFRDQSKELLHLIKRFQLF